MRTIIFLFLAAWFCVPAASDAQWLGQKYPWLHNWFATDTGIACMHHAVPDGEHGAFIVWGMNRIIEGGASEALFVQHVDSIARRKFTHRGGIPIGIPGESCYFPDIISNDAQGAIVAFTRHRAVPGVGWKGGVGATRLLYGLTAAGWQAIVWDDSIDYRKPVQMATDMRGGAWIIAHFDSSMFLKRVTANGGVIGTKRGALICETVVRPVQGDQPDFISDGAGGAYVVWMDFRKAREAKVTGTYYHDLWAQHIDSSGALLWGTQGIPIDTSVGWHSEPRLLPDGSGGVYVTYYNNVDTSINVQRLNPDGTSAWNPRVVKAGRLLRNHANYLTWPDVVLFVRPSFDNDMIIVTCEQMLPPNSSLYNTWFQRITPDGQLRWNNGKGVTVSSSLRLDDVASDDSGGVFTISHAGNVHFTEMVLQRRLPSGVKKLVGLGESVYRVSKQLRINFSSYLSHRRSNLLPDGKRGVIGIWTHDSSVGFNAFEFNFYAFRADAFGIRYPVELAMFTATLGSDAVHLAWRTETETNNYGFTVERSPDNNTWTEAGFVLGNGTTASASEYRYIDPIDDMLRTSGVLYYRLRQQDYDGTITYSHTVSVVLGAPAASPGGLAVYPNPARGMVAASFATESPESVSVALYNALGEKVRESVPQPLDAGAHVLHIATSGLPPGVYQCMVHSNSGVRTARVAVMP